MSHEGEIDRTMAVHPYRVIGLEFDPALITLAHLSLSLNPLSWVGLTMDNNIHDALSNVSGTL